MSQFSRGDLHGCDAGSAAVGRRVGGEEQAWICFVREENDFCPPDSPSAPSLPALTAVKMPWAAAVSIKRSTGPADS